MPKPNSKKALKLHNNQVVQEQIKVGLIKQTTVDISDTNFIAVKYWMSKSHFEKGRKNWIKVSKKFNEMGAVIFGVGGEANINMLNDFNNHI